MHSRDAVFLEDLCPKLRNRRWRQSIHLHTGNRCIYCGKPSESIDHVFPLSRGGMSVTKNCVPACLSCNGQKSDADVFDWYRRQRFYDPRRAMAIRAWTDGDPTGIFSFSSQYRTAFPLKFINVLGFNKIKDLPFNL